MTFVHCAPRSTPPHFAVNVMKIIVLCVLTHVLRKWKSQLLVLCCVLYTERLGVDSMGGAYMLGRTPPPSFGPQPTPCSE